MNTLEKGNGNKGSCSVRQPFCGESINMRIRRLDGSFRSNYDEDVRNNIDTCCLPTCYRDTLLTGSYLYL